MSLHFAPAPRLHFPVHQAQPGPLVDFEALPGESAQQRYDRFWQQTTLLLLRYYPGLQTGARVLLPASEPEFLELAGPNAEAAYAISRPNERRVIFSSAHQIDLALFTGTLTPARLNEVRAVKALLHESLHFLPFNGPDQWANEVEAILGEGLIELQACWHTLNNVKHEGSKAALLEGVRESLSHRNRYPWMVDVGVLVAGRDVLDWVARSLTLPARRVVNDVLFALQNLGLTRAEAVTYVKTPLEEGTPSEVNGRLEAAVGAIVPADDRFAWYVAQEWKV